MDKTNIFIIKVLLILWVVCIVLCEHQKRDVHRIVIKEKIPRGQKKGHAHTHERDHKRGRHSSKNKGHSHKHKTKTHLDSYEKSSEEDSYSTEDNFQKHKGHKSYHSDSKKSHSSPPLHISQDFEETKYTPFKYDSKFAFQNEWIPLSSEQVHHSHETHRDRYKRKQNSRKNYLTSLKPPPIDLTTSYPFQFEASSPFPPIIAYPNAFSNFNLNQKIIESNQSPLIGTIEHPGMQISELNNYNRLKNHRTSYEVTELTPADSNTNTFISVPDPVQDTAEVTTKISKHKTEEEKNTQQTIRNRGRATFRGKNKA